MAGPIKKLIAGAAMALATLAATLGAEAQTSPILVIGPIAQTPESHAFGGAAYTQRPENLAKDGYVEEEFIVSGKANVYDWPASGGPAVIKSSDAPYTTRVLVRRPTAAKKFSGRIIVEMLNPSNLMDLNLAWAIQHDELIRSGDAWVGVTAKPIAMVTLKTFDPRRYASLSWANPLLPEDPNNCANIAADSSRDTENGLVWDMYTQIAQWLRSRDGTNPFLYGGSAGPHPVKRLYGWGYSQTGGFLFTYINAIQPLAWAKAGRAPFDGYIVAMLTGPSPISQCAERMPAVDPRRAIRDAGVPVIHVMSQSDYLGWAPLRREDSDAPGDQYRHYDLSGAGHATPDELWYAANLTDIVKGGRTPPAVNCDQGPRSRFPSWVGFNAIYHNLKDWVEKGIPPPPSQNIQVRDGKGVLDEHDNVKGGVRSPLLDVPTSTWLGNSTGQSFCRIAGHEIPFSKDKLKTLYKDQGDYESAYKKSVDKLVKARFITKDDGEALKKHAKDTKVR